MSTTPSEGTLSTVPSQSKLSRKQRREVRLAEAAQQAVVTQQASEAVAKLSRKQRSRQRLNLQSDPYAPGPSQPSDPAPSVLAPSYDSDEDMSYRPSTSEGSQSSTSSEDDDDGRIRIRKTKPVPNPEAWLRTKSLIQP